MITVDYASLKDEQFAQSFSKLSHFTGFKSIKVAMNVAKIAKTLNDEVNKMSGLHLSLLKSYAVTDEAGNIQPIDPKKPSTYVIKDELRVEWKEVAEKFDATTFTINREPLRLDDLAGAPLSPIDLIVLEPLLYKPLEIAKS